MVRGLSSLDLTILAISRSDIERGHQVIRVMFVDRVATVTRYMTRFLVICNLIDFIQVVEAVRTPQ